MATGVLTLQVEFKDLYKPNISLQDMEKAWIRLAMNHHKDNIQAASKSLGISRATLYRKLGEINATHTKQNS